VFGEVVGIHIDEAVITNGRVDIAKAQPVTRRATWTSPWSAKCSSCSARAGRSSRRGEPYKRLAISGTLTRAATMP
jgi:hypothetical protein